METKSVVQKWTPSLCMFYGEGDYVYNFNGKKANS